MTSQFQLTMISADHQDPVVALIIDLFGNQQVYQEPGTRVLQFKGDLCLNLCNHGAEPPDYLSAAPQPILSFSVPNLNLAMQCAVSLGAAVAEYVTDACSGAARCYVRWPDGRVVGFWQSGQFI